jgi:hypothetical protein
MGYGLWAMGEPSRSLTTSLGMFWLRGRVVERIAYVVGALLIASGLVHLAILIGSSGSWEGPLSWRKPMTFGLSFGLTLIAIAWVSTFLVLSDRARTLLLGAFTAACALETALVSLQTWRGVPSHFNIETAFDSRIARTLAAGGGVLVIVILVLTIAAFRTNRVVPVSMRVAIRVGLVALLGAQIVGALMIAKGMTLVFAGHPQAAYATGGAFKPTHAVLLHGLQLLPVLAWLLSFADWPDRRRLAVVVVTAAGYLVVVVAIAVRNFAAPI